MQWVLHCNFEWLLKFGLNSWKVYSDTCLQLTIPKTVILLSFPLMSTVIGWIFVVLWGPDICVWMFKTRWTCGNTGCQGILCGVTFWLLEWMKVCTVNLYFLAFGIQLIISNFMEFIWSVSNGELNFLIFEVTYSLNNVYIFPQIG